MIKDAKSRIGFGGAALSGEGGGYGFGSVSEQEAEALIKSAWERGVRLFDTAPIYGFGLSEERLGRYLPLEAFIVTKGGVDWHESRRVNMTNEPEVIEKMLLASLKRLQRESIDLYMIHWPDPKVDIRKPLEVLKRYQDQGVIKKIGLCNTNAHDLKLAQEVVTIEALQSELNLFNTHAFAALEWSSSLTMGWGTFDKGILTGRVHAKRNFELHDCRSWAPWWNKKEVLKKIARVERLQSLLLAHALTLEHFALNYSLHHFGLNFALVGPKNIQDLHNAIDLAARPLDPELASSLIKEWQNE